MTMDPEDDYLVAGMVADSAARIASGVAIVDDLTQLRVLYSRAAEHGYLAVEVIAAADAFIGALFGNRAQDTTALHEAYKDRRAEYERVMLERPIE